MQAAASVGWRSIVEDAMSQVFLRRAQFIFLLGILSLWANVAVASPITVGAWYEFGFDPAHSTTVVPGCFPADPSGVACRPPDPGVVSTFLGAPPWTFASATAVVLTITDVFLAGDIFQVSDNGGFVGSTNAVPLGSSCGVNPDACLANPNFSHGTFLLSAGSHSITVGVAPAQILGEGFFRVDAAPVPEPSTLSLLALGFSCFIARMRRRDDIPSR